MNERSETVSKGRTRKRRVPAPEGFYGCPKCRIVKPVHEFYPDPEQPRGHAAWCRACKLAEKRRRAEAFTWTITDDIRARFAAKVRIAESGCHEWTSSKGRHGYGLFYLNGRQLSAHRIALVLAGQMVPEYDGGTGRGAVVDHICRNPGCVNPAHLRIVPQAENCTTYAKGGVFKRNRETVACVNGHRFTFGNTSILLTATGKPTRTCLTCYPQTWLYSIEPRDGGPRARTEWRGPRGPFRVDDEGIVRLKNV